MVGIAGPVLVWRFAEIPFEILFAGAKFRMKLKEGLLDPEVYFYLRCPKCGRDPRLALENQANGSDHLACMHCNESLNFLNLVNDAVFKQRIDKAVSSSNQIAVFNPAIIFGIIQVALAWYMEFPILFLAFCLAPFQMPVYACCRWLMAYKDISFKVISFEEFGPARSMHRFNLAREFGLARKLIRNSLIIWVGFNLFAFILLFL